MEITTRPYLNAGLAMSSAVLIAVTPLTAANGVTPLIHTPHVAATNVHLSALVTQADVDALVANLDTVLHSVDSTLASVASVPGTTVQDALNTAAALNNSFWTGLIGATNNSALSALLAGLRASSNGGLTSLAATAGSLSGTLTLTTGQVATLLTSVLTGSAGTAAQAVAAVVNNPLALSSYTNLVNVPLNLVGVAANAAITAADQLGDNALSAANTLVHGVTAQISNLLSVVNGVVNSAQAIADNNIIDGFLTAAQGIVIAPTSAVVELVNGVSSVLTTFGTTVLDKVAAGASAIATDWVGNGTVPGALQNVVNAIGTNPLSPVSYTAAVGALVSAAVDTGYRVITTAGSLVAAPVYATATATIAAAKVAGAFVNGAAYVASGLLTMLGTPRFISNLPHDLAGTVITAMNLTAHAVAAAINGVGNLVSAGASAANALAATTIPATTKIAGTAATPVAALAATSAAKAKGITATESPSKTAAAAPGAAGEPGHSAVVSSTKTQEPAVKVKAAAPASPTGTDATAATSKSTGPSGDTASAGGKSAPGSDVGANQTTRHDADGKASTVGRAPADSGTGKHRAPASASASSSAAAVSSESGGRHRRSESPSRSTSGGGVNAAHGHTSAGGTR
ncbi:hypothetical protein ACJH6J_20335 [Mycobacterium sp. SMC-18]|uniref:hypothetical protein n=1 Tax=unclassified Mycobacterium TaxID=2642494 RepID=UPI0038778E01